VEATVISYLCHPRCPSSMLETGNLSSLASKAFATHLPRSRQPVPAQLFGQTIRIISLALFSLPRIDAMP